MASMDESLRAVLGSELQSIESPFTDDAASDLEIIVNRLACQLSAVRSDRANTLATLEALDNDITRLEEDVGEARTRLEEAQYKVSDIKELDKQALGMVKPKGLPINGTQIMAVLRLSRSEEEAEIARLESEVEGLTQERGELLKLWRERRQRIKKLVEHAQEYVAWSEEVNESLSNMTE